MIRILSLYLKDFMSINEANLDFNNHINFIVGNPGTGKSAIFEAIGICLSDEKRSKAYGEYVQQGKDQAVIKLKCLINSKEANFDVKLNCVKGGAFEGELTYDDKVYKGSTQISTFLKSLELDYYLKIIFSKQNQKNIVDYSPADRLVYLQKLFDCDFSEQKEKVSTLLKDTKSKIDSLLNEKNTNNVLINELSKTEAIKENKISKDDYIKFLKELDAENEKFSKIKDNINQSKLLSKDIYETENKIKDIKRKIDDISKLSSYGEKLSSEIKTLEEQRAALNPKEEEEKLKLESIEIEIKDKKEKLATAEKMYQDAIAEKTKLEYEYSDFLKKKDLVNKGVCPHCGQPTNTLHPHIDAQVLNARLAVENKIKDYQDLGQQIFNLKQEISQLETGKKNFESTLNNILLEEKNLYSSITSRQHDLRQNNETVEELKKENLDEKQKELEESLKEMKENFEMLSKSEDESEKILSKIESYKNEISNYEMIEKLNEEILKRNKDKENRRKTLENRNLEIDKESVAYQNDVTVYTEAYNIFNKILPQYISKTTCDLLQQNINGFIHRVFPNFDVKLLNTDSGCDLKYTKDRTITDQKRNDKLNSKMSSGFERSVLDLSFKVSLAQSFGLDLFIGDEVDGACGDNFAVELIKEVLNKENFKQIFIISHKPVLVEKISEIFEGCNVYETNSGTFRKRD